MVDMQLAVKPINSRETWNALLRSFSSAHILQTWEWAAFKRETTGWVPERLAFYYDTQLQALASIQTRSIGPLRVMYVPRGPILDYTNANLAADVLTALQSHARDRRAIWLKIDPEVTLATGVPGEADDTPDVTGDRIKDLLIRLGWRYSDSQVQFRNTITIDLTQSEDDLLMNMSQNTRRKIRTAAKKDVTVRPATLDDLDVLYQLYRVTGARDDFLTRPPTYYEKAWRDFMEAGLAHALIAEVNSKPVAHVILFHFGETCWYMYGASSNEERQRMPNYALQWEAIQWAKAQGYRTYDMWGAPDTFDEQDRMWGVYEFKRGFRGTVVRHMGAWDYAPQPLLYHAYTSVWPQVMRLLRSLRQ